MQLAYALLVSDEVFNYVRQVQLEIHERFGENPELRLPPHITLKQPFEALQRRILQDLARHGVRPAEVEGPRHRFHCTVASGLDPERLAAVRDRFAACTVEYRFLAKTLCLFARLDSGDWIITRQAALQGVR